MITQVETLEEFTKCLETAGGKLVVVDFTAQWCGPCRWIAPIFHELSEEHLDVDFLKVDVDEASEVAEAYQISAMPTFHFYKNKNKVHELVGANTDKLKEAVKKHK